MNFHRLYLTEVGRHRAHLEAFGGWLANWTGELRSTCGPSQSTWRTDENQKAVELMTSDVRDTGDFYVGWYEAFKASSVFACYERWIRGRLLGDEDFGDHAALEHKRAGAQAPCARVDADRRDARADDTDGYVNQAPARRCI